MSLVNREDRAPLRSATITKFHVRRNFPTAERRLVRRCVSQHEDDFFWTKLRMRVFAIVFDRESCDRYDLRSTRAPELNVTPALLIPHAVTRRRTRLRAHSSGKTETFVTARRAITFVRTA
jgi:hypothetical protein